MTETEINEFIKHMNQIGDVWTPEQVRDVYNNHTLEDAIKERESLVGMHLNNLASLIK